jgi:hypothetical protein
MESGCGSLLLAFRCVPHQPPDFRADRAIFLNRTFLQNLDVGSGQSNRNAGLIFGGGWGWHQILSSVSLGPGGWH